MNCVVDLSEPHSTDRRYSTIKYAAPNGSHMAISTGASNIAGQNMVVYAEEDIEYDGDLVTQIVPVCHPGMQCTDMGQNHTLEDCMDGRTARCRFDTLRRKRSEYLLANGAFVAVEATRGGVPTRHAWRKQGLIYIADWDRNLKFEYADGKKPPWVFAPLWLGVSLDHYTDHTWHDPQ
ncbi:MAG: hypothetical protein J4G04_08355 [Nitrosopumilaceae archaeon]|nr:hypothetical protein [Nitrosopumilaceae archaeon]